MARIVISVPDCKCPLEVREILQSIFNDVASDCVLRAGYKIDIYDSACVKGDSCVN